MPKITKKHMTIGGAVLAIIIVLLIVKSCGSDVEYEYSYEEATVGTVEKTISATGVLEVDGRLPVPARINGLISSVKVSPEQKISRNQIMAVIDSSNIDQRLLMLNTRLESSRLNVSAQQRKYEGKKNMFKENLVSEKDLEQTELEYKTALNNHKLLQIEYSETLGQKRDTIVRSPINGIVVESSVAPLSSVRQNEPMFYVAPSLAKMQLVLNIDESDIGSIRKTQKVVFTVSAFPDKKFNGQITYVSINPEKKGGLVTYQSSVLCDNFELLLKPGMTATATIIVARKENVLRVPNQAFIVAPDFYDSKKSKGNILWKKSGNTLKKYPVDKVEVKIGLVGDMFTEVLNNIKKDDSVLIKMRQVDKR